MLVTSNQPALSILHNGHFIAAPVNILRTTPNVARIFDVIAVIHADPPHVGYIPLLPRDPAFRHKRYWRLPTQIGPILAALVDRVRYVGGCEEIVVARRIRNILELNLDGIPVQRPPLGQPGSRGSSDGSGPPSSSHRRGCGEDSPGGDRRGTKRRTFVTYQSSFKKQRRATGADVADGSESESSGVEGVGVAFESKLVLR